MGEALVPETTGYAEKKVPVEYRQAPELGPPDNVSDGILFLDRERNRIGIRQPQGTSIVSVPLSEVLELLRKGAL